MRNASWFHRLAAVRPADAGRTRELVAPAERARLLESTTATSVAAPKLRTRRRAASVGVLSGLTAAAACGALVVTGAIPLGGPAGVGPASTEPVHDVAYVAARSAAAMDDAAHDVIHSKWIPGNGFTFETWELADGSKNRSVDFRSDGQIDKDTALLFTKETESATVVSYPDRAWWTWSNSVDPNPCRGVPGCQPVPKLPGTLTPDDIRKQLADGNLKLEGDGGLVNGQQTVKLSGTLFKATSGLKTDDLKPFTLWVNTSTYLPVRVEFVNPDGGVRSQSDYTWLPPSADNLAQLEVKIPAGFVHSPEPITPPPTAGGGQG